MWEGCSLPTVATQQVRFGPFVLDAHAGELFKHGIRLKLQGHPIQILAMLLERPGELITREEIQQKLWPNESGTFVDFAHGLNTAVRKLRQALGDEAETPQYVETLPRRGYRFVGQLSEMADLDPGWRSGIRKNAHAPDITAANATNGLPGTVQGSSRTKRTSFRAFIVLPLLAAVLGAALWMSRGKWRTSSPLQVVATKQITFGGMVGNGPTTSDNFQSIQTDGRRVYFATSAQTAQLRSIAITGGEETTIPTSLKDPVILHLSPNGDYLIVRNALGESGSTEAQLLLVATNGGAARRLGNIEAQDAAFAPDGKTIVFAKGQALFMTDTQGAAPVKLADVAGYPFWLRWSPDGQRMRFSVQEATTQKSSLWEMGPDGKLRPLLSTWEKGQQVCCGIWTADGRNFLFLNGVQYWYVDEHTASDPKPAMLTSSGLSITAAVANPIGKEIFVSAMSPKAEVFAWDLKADRATLLYPEVRPFRLVYSPSGEQVAYTKRVDQGYELWLANVKGTDRRLVATAWRFAMVAFSPNGKKFAFSSRQADKSWKTYWGDVEGGVWHEIPGPPENKVDPNWSPDGQTILFGQPPAYMAEPGVERHLYTFDLRRGKTTVMQDTAGLFSPRWSPDGKYVAAMHADSKGMSVWEVTQSGWKPLFSYDVDNPFWSQDGTWVYFNGAYDRSLWRARVSDRKLERVLPLPMRDNYTACFGNGFTPNGEVLLSCFDHRRNIFALELR